jgi:enterochelin esterase family protein
MTITEKTLTVNSQLLGREVTCTLLMPAGWDILEPINLLLLNDGQELENLQLVNTLQALYHSNKIIPVLIAAVHAGDQRLQEYGVAGRPDYRARGSKAAEYGEFILKEMLPLIQQQTGINHFITTAFAGVSLGGLSAFDFAWNHPGIINKVGVFSGSFWWRSKGLDEGYTDDDRIMQSIIRETKGKPDVKFWIQTGTLDETADRNKNGIIDSIDDAIDMISELEKKGYNRPEDIQYLEVVGGHHDMPTWAKVMPKFLTWAFKP